MCLFDVTKEIKDVVAKKVKEISLEDVERFLRQHGQKAKKNQIKDFKKRLKDCSDEQLKMLYEKANGEGRSLVRSEMDRRGI